MLDHVGFAVSDYSRNRRFYEKALAPLGLTLVIEPSGQAAGFGVGAGQRPSFWVEAQGEPGTRPTPYRPAGRQPRAG